MLFRWRIALRSWRRCGRSIGIITGGNALADEVITALAEGESWGTALKKKIFEPLGIDRTITSGESKLDNRAEPYSALTDGTPYHLPRPFPEDGQIMQGAVGVQSCVHDLLLYYTALMNAAVDQADHQTTSINENPLDQAQMLFKTHIPMSKEPSERGEEKLWFGLGPDGAACVDRYGTIGLNPGYVPEMPIIGKGFQKLELCLWHQRQQQYLSGRRVPPPGKKPDRGRGVEQRAREQRCGGLIGTAGSRNCIGCPGPERLPAVGKSQCEGFEQAVDRDESGSGTRTHARYEAKGFGVLRWKVL